MRNGSYAIYNGVEYRFTSSDNNQVILKSNDLDEVNKGFRASLHHKGVYLKHVPKDALSEIYSIYTIATYKGYDFLIRSEEGNRVHLEGSGNENLITGLGFDYTEDRCIYRKWVNKSDITAIREIKTPIE